MVGINVLGERVESGRAAAPRRAGRYERQRALRDAATLILHDRRFTPEEIALILGHQPPAVERRLADLLRLREELTSSDEP